MKAPVTETNPNGAVAQCERRGEHSPHEHQAEFGAYFNAWCPGVKGKKPPRVTTRELLKDFLTNMDEHGWFDQTGMTDGMKDDIISVYFQETDERAENQS